MRGYQKIITLLAFSSFCMGVAEFIISGILPSIAKHFAIPSSQAGNLATLYALGVVIGAPLISVLISSWHYKLQLCFTMLVFSLANIIIFFSNIFHLTLFARFVCGLMHGLFFVIATIIAIKVAPKSKTTTALSLMVSGLTIALVTGVPLGIFLSESYGLLSPFAFIGIISFCVCVGAFYIMPRLESKKSSFKNMPKAFAFPPVYQGFIITAFTCGSQFVIYVYLRVFLEGHGFSDSLIKQIFIYYGIAAILGNLFGGRLADRKGTFKALYMILIAQIIFFGLMSLSYAISQLFIILNIIAMAFVGFASIAPLKSLSTYLASTYTKDSKNDTIALNEASFNVGIALAAFVGGVVEHYISVNLNGIFAMLFSFVSVVVLVVCIKKLNFNKT